MPLDSPVRVQRFIVFIFGVCNVKRLDILVVPSREVRKYVVLIQLIIVNYNYMEGEKGKI